MGPNIKTLIGSAKITLIASDFSQIDIDYFNGDVDLKIIPIGRNISIFKDIFALLFLILYLKRGAFSSVHSIMPKSGFIAMLASYILGTHNRLHTFTGQIWVTRKGFFRLFLIKLDQIIAFMATRLLTDSVSQKLFLANNRIGSLDKIDVLGLGSIAGVDACRFSPNDHYKKNIRSQLLIPESSIVFLYVGRLNHDKGISDLLLAFELVRKTFTNVNLLLVGPDEEGYDSKIKNLNLRLESSITRVNFTDFPERYMAAADIFCLPSYREGFSNVIIQSASSGLPSVSSRINGIIDAVVDGRSGFLHEVSDIASMSKAMILLATNEVLRKECGSFARKHVIQFFSQERLTLEFKSFYSKLLSI